MATRIGAVVSLVLVEILVLLLPLMLAEDVETLLSINKCQLSRGIFSERQADCCFRLTLYFGAGVRIAENRDTI